MPCSFLDLKEASLFDDGYTRRKKKKKKAAKCATRRKSSVDGDWASERKGTKKRRVKVEETDDGVELERRDRVRKKKQLGDDFLDTDKAVQEHSKRKWRPKTQAPDFVSRSVHCVMEKIIKGVENLEDRERRKQERDASRAVKRQLKLDEMMKKRKATQMQKAEQKQLKQVHNQFEFSQRLMGRPPAAAVNVPIVSPFKTNQRPKPYPTPMMKSAQKMMRTLPQMKFPTTRAMPEYLEHLMKTPTSSNTVQFRMSEQPKVDNNYAHAATNYSYQQQSDNNYSYQPSYQYAAMPNETKLTDCYGATGSNAVTSTWQQTPVMTGIRQPMILLRQLTQPYTIAQQSTASSSYQSYESYTTTEKPISTPRTSTMSQAGEYAMAYPSTSAVSNSVPLPPFSAVHRQSPRPYLSPFETHFKGFIESTYNRYLS